MQQQSAVPTSVVPSSVKCSIVTKAFELKCYRRIPYTDHITNEEVLRRVGQSRALLGRVMLWPHFTPHLARERHYAWSGSWYLASRWTAETMVGRHHQVDIVQTAGVVHLAEDRICHHEFVHRVAYTPHRVW